MERQAAVKLTLDSGQFVVSLKQVGSKTEQLAREGKKVGDTFGGALKSADRAATNFAHRLGGLARDALTLGGAFTLGKGIKDTIEMQGRIRALAFSISNATGEQVKAVDVQRDLEHAAGKTSRTTAEMLDVFSGIQETTGDAAFARDSLEAIGTTATATGKPLSALANVAGTLREKFGTTAKELPQVLAGLVEMGDRGGPKLEDVAQVASQLGSNLVEAGLTGRRGLDFLTGALNELDDKSGDVGKSARGISQVLLNLGKGTEMKGIAKALAIDPKKLINEKDAIARLMKILSFGEKGVKALNDSFTSVEERKALGTLFVDPFEEALNRAHAGGIKGKDAIDAALRVLEARIEKFGEANLTAADIKARAAEEMKQPEAKLRGALERLNLAFQRPEIIGAIDQMSQSLPALAGAIGSVIEWISSHLPGSDADKASRQVDKLVEKGRDAAAPGTLLERRQKLAAFQSEIATTQMEAKPGLMSRMATDLLDDPLGLKRTAGLYGASDYRPPSQVQTESTDAMLAKAQARADSLRAGIMATESGIARFPSPGGAGAGLDGAGANALGAATAAAVAGKVLQVRVTNASELAGRSGGSSGGGSRGPVAARPTRSGGGV